MPVSAESLLVEGGTVVTSDDARRADVMVEGEVIRDVGPNLSDKPVGRVIDATGCYVLPGGVDAHTHLDFPLQGTTTSDDFSSGTVAAAHGGTTTVISFARQYRGETLPASLDQWHAKADDKAAVDYAFHLIVTDLYRGATADLRRLIRDGVTSFKLYMAYPGDLMVDDGTIYRVMEVAGREGGLVCLHAENGSVVDVLVRRALEQGRTGPAWHARTRPEAAEAEAVARARCIAGLADAPVYFVHLSCHAALAEVEEGRAADEMVFAETCPHYLVLDDTGYDAPGFDAARYVLTPPLRSAANQDSLWAGLRAGSLQVVASDHCPTCMVDKRLLGRDDFSRIPNGAPGIEHRLVLLYDRGVVGGRLTLPRLVELFATGPARLFGLFPRKGTVAPGSDADLVIFDPAGRTSLGVRDHHMNFDYSLYEGTEVTGRVRTVLARGRIVADDGCFVGEAGRGQFLVRAASGRP
jgi:dihydropyrimidinase